MLLVYFIAFHRITAEGKRKEGETIGIYVCKTLMICLSFAFVVTYIIYESKGKRRDRDNFIERIPIKLERAAKLGHALPLTTLPSNC